MPSTLSRRRWIVVGSAGSGKTVRGRWNRCGMKARCGNVTIPAFWRRARDLYYAHGFA